MTVYRKPIIYYPLFEKDRFIAYFSRTADFIPFVTSTFGLCYTFNAKLKNSTDGSVRDGNKYGGSGKLELGLYVHSNLYLPYMIDSKYQKYYFNKLLEIVYDC